MIDRLIFVFISLNALRFSLSWTWYMIVIVWIVSKVIELSAAAGNFQQRLQMTQSHRMWKRSQISVVCLMSHERISGLSVQQTLAGLLVDANNKTPGEQPPQTCHHKLT